MLGAPRLRRGGRDSCFCRKVDPTPVVDIEVRALVTDRAGGGLLRCHAVSHLRVPWSGPLGGWRGWPAQGQASVVTRLRGPVCQRSATKPLQRTQVVEMRVPGCRGSCLAYKSVGVEVRVEKLGDQIRDIRLDLHAMSDEARGRALSRDGPSPAAFKARRQRSLSQPEHVCVSGRFMPWCTCSYENHATPVREARP